MDSQAVLIGLELYLLVAAITLGHLYRSVRPKSAPAFAKIGAASLAWPAYWLLCHGVVGSVHTLVAHTNDIIRLLTRIPLGLVEMAAEILKSVVRSVMELASETTDAVMRYLSQHEKPLLVVYAIGIQFMFIHQVGARFDACADVYDCGFDLVKSVLWSIFWPLWFFA